MPLHGALDWAPWRFLLEQPWWLGGLLFALLAPVGLWLVRGLIQNIWVNPFTHDWQSSNADIALGIGFAAELWLASTLPVSTLPGWAHGVIIGALAFLALSHFVADALVVGIKRQLGATSVYHLFMTMVIGYPFVYLLVVTFKSGWDTLLRVEVHLVPILTLVVWVCAIFYDMRHPNTPQGESKFTFTTPQDGWRNIRLFWRWLTKPSGLARRMETLWFANIILNRRPIQGALVAAVVTPGMFIPINWVVYGMWVPFSYWWYSALIGDLLLAAAVGIMLWMADEKSIPDMIYAPSGWAGKALDLAYWLRVPLNLVLVGAMYWVGFAHMIQEHDGIGSWARHLGASSSYHNFVVYPLLGYALARLFFRSVFRAHWRRTRYLVAIILVVAMFVGWYKLGVYDGYNQLAPNGVPKIFYSSPPDGWQNIRIALLWILRLFGVG